MKYVAYIMGGVGMIVLCMMSVLTVSGRMLRQKELEKRLPEAVEQAVAETVSGEYKLEEDQEKFIYDFTEKIRVLINADEELTVRVMAADPEKGLLSVEVLADYVHPDGECGQVKCERTVILNKVPEKAKEYHRVTFYDSRESMEEGINYYKRFVIQGNDSLIPNAAAPEKTGNDFAGWRDSKDQPIDLTGKVTGDLSYYACFS